MLCKLTSAFVNVRSCVFNFISKPQETMATNQTTCKVNLQIVNVFKSRLFKLRFVRRITVTLNSTRKRTHIRTYTHARTHICTHTHARTHARTHTHKHARTHAYTHAHTHTHTHTHSHTHAHTHTYAHTHTKLARLKQQCGYFTIVYTYYTRPFLCQTEI